LVELSDSKLGEEDFDCGVPASTFGNGALTVWTTPVEHRRVEKVLAALRAWRP
jgi:hypothetical protein